MPFEKVGKNDYVGPSGRHFNKKQIKRYHANDESFDVKPQKKARGGVCKGMGKARRGGNFKRGD